MGVKHYDKLFKEQAAKLSYQRGNISEVSRELGIAGSQLTKWRKELAVYGGRSFALFTTCFLGHNRNVLTVN